MVQEKQEGKLNKLLKDAKKTIANLKAKIESLVTELSAVKAELAQYKSVRGKLRTADLEQENDRLRSRLRTYDDVISRNNLWHFFSGSRGKNRNRDDARGYPCRAGKIVNLQMGAFKSYSASFARSPSKNQPTFTGDELRKIREKQEVL